LMINFLSSGMIFRIKKASASFSLYIFPYNIINR
jgi:hypothetical protein